MRARTSSHAAGILITWIYVPWKNQLSPLQPLPCVFLVPRCGLFLSVGISPHTNAGNPPLYYPNFCPKFIETIKSKLQPVIKCQAKHPQLLFQELINHLSRQLNFVRIKPYICSCKSGHCIGRFRDLKCEIAPSSLIIYN